MAINKINGKRYIGVTIRDLRVRKREHFCHAAKHQHNGAFHRALRKYPKECFEFIVLKNCESGLDALREEVRLIAELRPEYNSTKGGDGRAWPRTAEERAKIGAHSRGNQYCLGKKLSDERKKNLSEINKTPKARELWAQYSHMGPKAMARPVVCVDDGLEYPSATAAAKHYGVAKSALIELCLGKNYRQTVGGLRFKYIERPEEAAVN